MSGIRNLAAAEVAVYYPETEEGRAELARRVADVHAAAVIQRIRSLNCPTDRKTALLEKILREGKENGGTE